MLDYLAVIVGWLMIGLFVVVYADILNIMRTSIYSKPLLSSTFRDSNLIYKIMVLIPLVLLYLAILKKMGML